MFPIIGGLTGLVPFAGRLIDLLQNIKDVTKKWQEIHNGTVPGTAAHAGELEAQRQQIIAAFNTMLAEYHDTIRQMLDYHESSDAQKAALVQHFLDHQAQADAAHQAMMLNVLAMQRSSEREREVTTRELLHFVTRMVEMALAQNQAGVKEMMTQMQQLVGQLQHAPVAPALPVDQQETIRLLPPPAATAPLAAKVADVEEAFDSLKAPLIQHAVPPIAPDALHDLGVQVRWECSWSDDFLTAQPGVTRDTSRVFVLIVNRVTMQYYVVAACGTQRLNAEVRAYRHTLDAVPINDDAWKSLLHDAVKQFDVLEPPFVTVPERGIDDLINRLQRSELFRAQSA